MIEEVDNRLREWASSVLEAPAANVEIRLTAPDEPGPQAAVTIFLLDLLPGTPGAAGRRPPLQITLRYLVSASAASVEDAHRLLGRVVFAAMERPDMEVELAPLSAEFWAALRCTPRPSFLLRVPLRLDRPEPQVGRVTHAAEVRHAKTAALAGRVVGPGDIPIAAAQVELPALRLVTQTDVHGYFRFLAVPADPARRQVTVRARGVEKAITVERPVAGGEPFIIHWDVT